MPVNLLLALDGSEHSMKSARYVADLLRGRDDVSITLFHVLACLPSLTLEYYEGLAQTVRVPERDWVKDAKASANEFLQEAKDVLQEAGFTDEQIRMKFSTPIQESSNVAHTICRECRNEQYDTIVIGKHGHSRIHEFLIGSVAEKVVRHTNKCVVWVIE